MISTPYYTLDQQYDRRTLAQLVANPKTDGDERMKLKALNDARDKSRGDIETGVVSVSYKLTSDVVGRLGYGRYYSKAPRGLETLQTEYRDTICRNRYTDIDMVNAHPTLIVQMAKEYKLDMPHLAYYVANREKVFQEMEQQYNMTRNEMKMQVLRILYGGLPDVPEASNSVIPMQLKEIAAEMKTFVAVLAVINKELYDHLKADRKKNLNGRFASYCVQKEERKCLDAMVEYFNTNGYPVSVLAYDGCMVASTNVSEEALREAEVAVMAATGYEIRLAIKPMYGFTNSDLTPSNEEGFVPESVIINDRYAAETYIALMGDSIVSESGQIYIYNEETGMWKGGDEELLKSILNHSASLIFKQKSATGIKTFDYGGSMKRINSMMEVIRVLVPSSNFISTNSTKSLMHILFNDGIYHIPTQTFTLGFNKEMVFTAKINKPFYAERNKELEAQLNQTLFINPFTDSRDGEYFKLVIARAIAGHYQDKKFYAILGEPNCGKGTITQALNHTFGGYVGEWNINNLKYNPRSGTDEAKKLSWLVPLRCTRCAFSNEGRMDRYHLDGNMMKTMASGGDSIQVRQNFKDESAIVLLSTFFYLGNDIAHFSPMDRAVQSRLRFIRFVKTFVSKPIEECGPLEMPMNATLKDCLKTEEYINAFFWIIMDAYKAEYPHNAEPPNVCIETEANVVIDECEIKDRLQERYEITADVDDTVPCQEVLAFLKTCGFAMSDNKIGRQLHSFGLKTITQRLNGKSIKVYTGLKA